MTGERARESFARFDKRLTVLRASDPSLAVACKSGCAHCCYPANLQISRSEAAAIVEHVETSWSAADRDALRERVEHAAGMAMMDRWNGRVPCPLLDEQAGTCMAYEVRPLRCRGWSSTDVSACEARDGTPIPTVLAQHKIAKEIRRELALDDQTELAAALLRHLRESGDPES
jgi:Fe-S-cluster containining protein